MGHLIPFFQLSKSLARKDGIRISFVSTPRNLQKLPKIPPNLSSLITLVSLPFLHDHVGDNLLPENAESSTDIPIEKTQLLKKAFDGLESSLSTFLQNSNPAADWIIHDYASHWLPTGIVEKLGIPCVYFGVFTAASLAFIGPPEVLIQNQSMNPEDFTTVPKWVPFPSNVVYRFHELLQYNKGAPQDHDSGVPDTRRFGFTIRDSEFVALRSCVEFESDWLTLLSELYQKPVIPLGLLPPSMKDTEDEGEDRNDNWVVIKEWLDKQREGSVVYVALGTEAALSQEQVNELALGLESSKLPFFWVLRKSPGLNSAQDQLSYFLPDGFEDRIRGRGIVHMSWVPQVRILGHQSVGGFLTHCGFNSVIEGLAFGRVLILLPMLNDQGLNARLLEGKKVGLEIPRNERDGSFSSESVAESLRVVMVEKEGEVLRNKAKEMKEVFGDIKLHESYMNSFVQFLKDHRKPTLQHINSIPN
ncbi:UDP-glucuronosyl/UDP-glucosyltransferase [Macleaya cordata]|uniref:UDP-glucuronosyl/UDP-glucosyltransferase n=1 Tax=Macleaya cordata TaxID=56857 RepID=A0A200PNI7_MACCD|nr:UDP-glucuronosyl/UDP-glucosyltransferase [Macleaya cordata]